MNHWHTQSIQDTVSALKTRVGTGLGQDEAVARRETYGPNELEERAGKSPLRMLWEQFTETMVLILIAAAIVAAVREGRAIYDNLLRFIKFSIGGNLGKVLVMLGAPLLGINVALSPLQLLWLNLLTDGLRRCNWP